MDVESHDNGIYTKVPDKVDKYIIKMMYKYFSTVADGTPNSVEAYKVCTEAIIQECVKRVKQEVMDALKLEGVIK